MKLSDLLEGDVISFPSKGKKQPTGRKTIDMGDAFGTHGADLARQQVLVPAINALNNYTKNRVFGFRDRHALQRFIRNHILNRRTEEIPPEALRKVKVLLQDANLVKLLENLRSAYNQLYDEYGDMLEWESEPASMENEYWALIDIAKSMGVIQT